MRTVLGVIGVLVLAGSAVYYIRDVVRGDTRPQRTSWITWAIVGALGFVVTGRAGAGEGAWGVGTDALACTVIAVFSLRYGKPGGRPLDPLLGVLALSGMALWWLGDFSTTELAFAAVLFDLPAFWPTARDAWASPDSESMPSWAVDILGHACCLLAIAHWSPAAALFPAYLLVQNVALTAVLIGRRGVTGMREPSPSPPSAVPVA